MRKFLLLSVSIVLIPAFASAERLTILHFNDFHAAFDPGSKKNCAGAARLAALIESEKTKSENAIVLFGGDLFTGSLYSLEYKGEVGVKFLNSIGIKAATIGNHEFDFGTAILLQRISESSFPWISSNIYWKEIKQPIAPPSAIIEAGKIKIGIIGALTQSTPSMTMSKNVEGLSFRSPTIQIRRQISELPQKSDMMIALTHLGVEGDEKLAREVKSLSAIIGGHDHVAPKDYCRTVGSTPVCQTPASGQYLGRLVFDIKDKKATLVESELIPVGCNITPDPRIQSMLKTYGDKVEEKYGKKICDLKTALPHSRKGESLLGDDVTDLLKSYTNVELAFVNSSGIRAPLKKGAVKLSSLVEILPFENNAMILKMPGHAIRETFLYSINDARSALQFSGAKVALCNGEIRSFEIDGKPLEDDKVYSVATDSYIANGGSGYRMLKQYIYKDTGKLVRDIIAEGFGKQKLCPVPMITTRAIDSCEKTGK